MKNRPLLRNQRKSNEKLGPCYETDGNQMKHWDIVTEPKEIKRKDGPLLRNRWTTIEKNDPCYEIGGNQTKTRSLSRNWWKSNAKLGPCYETEGNRTKKRALVAKLLEIKWTTGPLLRNLWKSNAKTGPGYETVGNQMNTWALVMKPREIKRKKGPCYEIGGNLMNTTPLLRNRSKSNKKPLPCYELGLDLPKNGTSLRNRWTLNKQIRILFWQPAETHQKTGPCYETGGNSTIKRDLVTKLVETQQKTWSCKTDGNSVTKTEPCYETGANSTRKPDLVTKRMEITTWTLLRNQWELNKKRDLVSKAVEIHDKNWILLRSRCKLIKKNGTLLQNWRRLNNKTGSCYETGGNQTKSLDLEKKPVEPQQKKLDLVTILVEIQWKTWTLFKNRRKLIKETGLCYETGGNSAKKNVSCWVPTGFVTRSKLLFPFVS